MIKTPHRSSIRQALLFSLAVAALLGLCGGSSAWLNDPVLWLKGQGDRCEGAWLVGFSKDVLAPIPPPECDAIITTHADNGYIRVMRILTRDPTYGGDVTHGRAVSSDILVSGIVCRFIYIQNTHMAFLVVAGQPYMIDLRAAEVKYGGQW